MKISIVEKHSDLNGISEKELDLEQQDINVLLSSDIVVADRRHYRIIKKAYSTDGHLILFVEGTKSYKIDEDFIDYYFIN
ncbi:hypothetical protein CSV71_15045 [Sporosarcina sp. P21c]|uniref:hypothetical protein n=1 Tax=Sporosarcina sp. P21c TaxID=2048255 RepID=UPI000C16761A|nr:hypothetical protein [Sporosarcina sp. P21c]PIC88439.1 hypothetical protein CSV71_15045 [Sporosarcina sp. P21c]